MREHRAEQTVRKLCVGLLAHVDAGKTTLSEGLLYVGGALRTLGRVDHRDAFLDTDALERERGITIFSKQAILPLETVELTLLDTPGHVDFSSEMERTLGVLDCALLVISGADGVQGHTETLWSLLARYQVPTFLFVNKMDLPGTDREALLRQLRSRLGEGCADFTLDPAGVAFQEQAAACDDGLLERYLETGRVEEEDIRALIGGRKLFPCWFGSALKLEGVAGLLEGLERYAPRREYPAPFGARVYQIGRDPQGARLTHLKVTGGTLRVKTLLTGGGEDPWEEKVDQIRIYSGPRFRAVEEAPAGTVCAVTGLSRTRAGEGLGAEAGSPAPLLEPVLTYRMVLPRGADPYAHLPKLRQLEEEDPQLHMLWDETHREIRVQLMGEVQLEVLQRRVAQRFGLAVTFDAGHILYRETIAAPVEGVGHFEPLRHYAEVHLLLEPGERGSGLRFASACGEDMLEGHWQRLILTHLAEREHLGVLTGSPITDMKITLVAGRAHQKHTEGGDFRQATYRAVRQGLMSARSLLLEPWYSFRLEVPEDQVGRAMHDLQRRGAAFDPPELGEGRARFAGGAPVAALRDYAVEVAAYTRGRGRLSLAYRGYEPCHDPQAVIAAAGYDPLADQEHTPDSVFCGHGAGFVVKWDQVRSYMHVDSGLALEGPPEEAPEAAAPARRREGAGSLAGERELQAVFERTYGKVEQRAFRPQPKPARTSLDDRKYAIRERETGPEYLLVDGYNIIHAWEELRDLARSDLEAARKSLMDILSNYRGFRKCEVILVFDAYKVKGNPGSVLRYHNIHVVYTKEAETADNYIERVTYEIGKKHRVRVATSDSVEQLIILGHGALRVSARAFRQEIEEAEGQIAQLIAENNRKSRKLDKLEARLKEKEGP